MAIVLGSLCSAKHFGFLLGARKHKILTIDKLQRRKHFLANGFPMCLKEEETANHLLIHCQFSYKVWMAMLNFFDLSWVMPKNVGDLFLQWCL